MEVESQTNEASREQTNKVFALAGRVNHLFISEHKWVSPITNVIRMYTDF